MDTVALADNVDTVALADTLWSQPTVRDSLTALAEDFATTPADASGAPSTESEDLRQIRAQIAALELPLGWQQGFPSAPSDVLSKIIGLLMVGFEDSNRT